MKTETKSIVNKMLNSIGKECFVKYFEICNEYNLLTLIWK